MEILKSIIWVVQIISAVLIVIFVLLQHGKGADIGATFGSSGNGSNSLFGSSGSANFLSHVTAGLAVVFFISTFVLVLLTTSGRFNTLGVMAGFKNNASTSVSSQKILPTNNIPASGPIKNQIPTN
jgi:preprotein translocase subunit SecG